MIRASQIANKMLNTKAMSYLTKPNASSAAATIALVSNVSKDAVNCYYYVVQSLNNEKIPEEKRKFVASLDLSNGILNIITQFAIGIPIAKQVSKFFDKKIAPKYFSEAAAQEMFKKIKPNVNFENFLGKFSRNKSFAKTGLAVIATLVGTQIIAKRILVPFLATPMASFFKKKFEENQKQNPSEKTSIPSQKTQRFRTPSIPAENFSGFSNFSKSN